jgi:hypothetical protein
LIELTASYKPDALEFLPTVDETATTLQVYWQRDQEQWSDEYGWALLLAGSSHYLSKQLDLACQDFQALERVEGNWQVNAYGDHDFLGHFAKQCKEKTVSSGGASQP